MTISDGPIHERTQTTVATPTEEVPAPVAAPLAAPVAAPVAAPITAPVTTAPSTTTMVEASSAARFEPDAFIAGGVGLVLLVIGLIAAIRGGFHGPMSLPVVKVLGFTHTTTLGLVEVAIGGFLLAAAALRSRAGETFGGLVLAVAGFIGVVQHVSFVRTLALEQGWAWIATIAGAVVALAALLLPRFVRHSTTMQAR